MDPISLNKKSAITKYLVINTIFSLNALIVKIIKIIKKQELGQLTTV
jgi:hypothetical protein